ncbi:MAG: GNAT family N-acetyltransferase [Dactylosporangium sp.]|nr:GNAT family N-acetyltransferase [Dactylosporangium sp.]NNJ62768.1 GNAT family N-acetyltransferase [Dactylosporangium sp.]
MLRECDPSTASTTDVMAAVQIMNEVLAADLPEDPPWQLEKAKEYLTVTMPGERRFTWHALDSDNTTLLGRASLLITEEIGVLELMVRPAARRRRVGTALLAAIAQRAAAEGVEALGVEVAGGTPSVGFFEAHGFRRACTELRAVLTLESVDWQHIATVATGIGAGYRIEVHPDGPPSTMFETYTAAKEAIRSLEYDDLELSPSSYGPDRLEASLETLRARGMKPYVVVAVHERTETVAALTEVVVPEHRPTRADQYDTVVVPAHRSYGADRAIKARMLLELRAAESQLLDVQTWNAAENAQMLKINSELGFRIDREWREYAADAAALARQFTAPGLTH